MRKYAYINRKPQDFTSLLNALSSTNLFLVNRKGPVVFIVKDNTNYTDALPLKVTIGSTQSCSCGGGLSPKSTFGKTCIHIIFVMTKVLRVPPCNELAWQLSLTDKEVTDILSGVYSSGRARQELTKRSTTLNVKEMSSESLKVLQRKDLKDDRICSICQEDMTDKELENSQLCFCQKGCASNFHVKCMKMVEAYSKSQNKALLCPLCRTTICIDMIASPKSSIETKPSRKHKLNKSQVAVTSYIRCSSCLVKISGNSTFFRCVSSKRHDNCKRCFESYRGQDHIYVSAKVLEYPHWNWEVSIPRSRNSSNLDLRDLQTREINNQDYEMLLSLDNNVTPLLHNHLTRAIQTVNNKSGICSICSKSLDSFKGRIKHLPCRSHFAHEECIISLLMEKSSLGCIEEASCPECSFQLFPDLSRPPKTATKCKREQTIAENKLYFSKNLERENVLIEGIEGKSLMNPCQSLARRRKNAEFVTNLSGKQELMEGNGWPYQKICSNEKSSAYSSKIALPQLIESQDKKITAKEKRKFISYPLRSCNSVPKPLTLTIAPKSKQNKVQSSLKKKCHII